MLHDLCTVKRIKDRLIHFSSDGSVRDINFHVTWKFLDGHSLVDLQRLLVEMKVLDGSVGSLLWDTVDQCKNFLVNF